MVEGGCEGGGGGVLTPFPITILDESINQGLACAHMHSIARTEKILIFMFWMGECQEQKHPAPSTKMECDYLYGWIKKKSHTQNHTKIVNLRDITGNTRER